MKRLIYPALLLSAACYGSQQSACETGRGPTPLPPSPTPTATPSPTPTPTPVLAADDCKREFATVDFLFMSGPISLPYGEQGRYDLTPKQYCREGETVKTRDVPDKFNEPKSSSVVWSQEGDRSLGTLIPDGFAAYFTRRSTLGGGPVPAVILRADFEGKFVRKVVQ